MTDISVIICAYTDRRWNELIAAVESVQQQQKSAKEIIVVIDHNPGLFQRAQEKFTGVNIIENHGDKGLSGARNSGWTAAQGDCVAFLDDDAMAGEDWLENLATHYEDPKVMGVGGKIIPLWETANPSWFPAEFNWVVGCTYRGYPNQDMPIRNMIGANMSMRKSVLASEGGFRESFGCDKSATNSKGSGKWFHHYAGDEETEFCIRASQRHPGNLWFYSAAAAVQHRVSIDRTRYKYFLWRCYDEGLGKASLASLHSNSQALATEKTYTLSVLPRGVARGIGDAFLRRDFNGLRRSFAIASGLFVTTVGYLIGNISTRLTSTKETGMKVSSASVSNS